MLNVGGGGSGVDGGSAGGVAAADPARVAGGSFNTTLRYFLH